MKNGININVSEIKSQLEKFGKVEQCEEREGMFHVKITSGFSSNANNTFKCSEIIIKSAAGDKYPSIKKVDTDENLFHLILKP